MEWVLFISLQWIVNGVALPPVAENIVLFPSEERCQAAATALRTEINKPIPEVVTYGRIVCMQRKDK